MQKQISCCFLCISVLILFASVSLSQENGEDRAYYDLGVFAYEDGDYMGAEENLKKAIQLNPDNPYYHHYLGKTYIKAGKYDEARLSILRALELDPDIPELRYDMALLDYELSDYDSAADLFIKIASEEPENALAQYYAGISLYKIEQYDRALGYLISASEMSPTIRANGYYYAGICYMETGDNENAAEKLEYVRDYSDSSLLQEYASRYLYELEKKEKETRPYSLYLKSGYRYDDNVRLDPLDQDRYANEDDYLAFGYFSGEYNLIDKTDNQAGAAYSHYQSWHNNLESYDLTGSIFNLFYKHSFKQLMLGFSYLPAYYWLDSDSYLMSHQLRPEAVWTINKKFTSRITYSYFRNNYFQDNEKDSIRHELALEFYYRPGKDQGYLTGRLGYEDNNASHPDEDYNRVNTKVNACFPFFLGFDLILSGRYQSKEYENIDSFYNIKREDDKSFGSISLSHELFYNWLSITGEFNYTKNDSNINDYSYKRKVSAIYFTIKL